MLKKEGGDDSLKKALLVTNSEQSARSLSELLTSEGYDEITPVFASYSAEEKASDDGFDVICINAPLAS